MASASPRPSSSSARTSTTPPASIARQIPPQPERLFSSPSNLSEYFLKLSDKVVHFDPVAKGTYVFFDDIQCQIFVVRDAPHQSINQSSMSHTATVSVRSPITARNMDFFIAAKGSVLSIKFSPDLYVLAVQRSNKSVEFINFHDSQSVDLVEYSQTCRARSAKILGFCWVSPTEIVLVTDSQGLESYQIRPEKKMLKSLKNYSLPVNWFLYTPPYLLLSSGNFFHIFILKPGGNYQRFPKFEVDGGPGQTAQVTKLLERDVVLAPVYGNLYVLIIKQVSKLNAGAEVVMSQVSREGAVKVTDVLLLECNGRFAINILDNLVVVHHQQSRMTKLFDLRLNARTDVPRYHYPIASFSIEPYQIKLSGHTVPYELYSSNWAVFLPSIIVDAKLGCLWQLELQVDTLASLISDKLKRVEFLLLRESDAKVVLLRHVTDFLHEPNDYPSIIKTFNLLNVKLKAIVTRANNEDMKKTVYLDQSEVFRYLLLPLSNSRQLEPRHIVGVLVEYLKSLIAHQLEPQYYIHELVVNALVQFKMFHFLRMLVENGVFFDSKPFACLLLSLEHAFPPAFQMALDMLKRVGNSSEERAEMLLANYQIFPAVRLLTTSGGQTEAQLAPRKFLEPAFQSGDNVLFYSVYRFFQQRNVRLRGSPVFLPDELCDDLVFQFDCLYPDVAPETSDLVF